MRERPILMSAPKVRAILDGRKTQTRRVVTGEALRWLAPNMFTPEYVALPENGLCPYGAPGDRLWVRETFFVNDYRYPPERAADRTPDVVEEMRDATVYRADGEFSEHFPEDCRPWPRWSPGIHMPRWASRLTLELTEVRVERVQDISESDALAEGVVIEPYQWRPLGSKEPTRQNDARHAYQCLWNTLNQRRGYGWDANPWVWVLSFRRVTP